MSALEEIAMNLATKNEVELHGQRYRIKNATFATDGERVMKMSVVLESLDDKVVDIDLSIRVY